MPSLRAWRERLRVCRTDAWALLTLTLTFGLLHGSIALSIPSFEPATHNDDWVHAAAVQRLVEEGRFQLHQITGTLAVPQIFAGWLLCTVVGGFSFTALRTMMVMHGIVPIWLLWFFLRRLNIGPVPAMLAVLLFCVNPITVSLTWSFQTDLVYLSFVLAALLATLWADRAADPPDMGVDTSPTRQRGGDTIPSLARRAGGRDPLQGTSLVLVAAALLLLAFLTRQGAVFVAVAVAAYWGLRRRWLWLALTLAVVPLMIGFEKWLICQSGLTYLPWVKGQLEHSLSDLSPGRFVSWLYETLHVVVFLGLLLIPLLAAARPRLTPGRLILSLFALSLVAAVFLIDMPAHRTPLPGNYVNVGEPCGIGPVTLEVSSNEPADVSQEGQHPVLMLIIAVTAFCGGGLVLVKLFAVAARLVASVRHWSCSPQVLSDLVFCASLAGMLAASVLIGRAAYDRYVLLLYPLAAPLCLVPSVSPRRLLLLTVPVGLLLVATSYAGTVDYWRWNEARWRALSWLESQGVTPERIDGGYEYNGIHDTLGIPIGMMNRRDRERQAEISAARKGRDVYLLRFRPRRGETVAARFPYTTPVLGTKQHIFVIRGRSKG